MTSCNETVMASAIMTILRLLSLAFLACNLAKVILTVNGSWFGSSVAVVSAIRRSELIMGFILGLS